ncbi:50S ribosomal protein L32e [Candidatus Pacearchaeota archaeon]|nr:50S ribosomal protein L32e [Candidatus Pacearchaeota archaeon]
MSKLKFYRRTYNRYGKLGMRRKKKRVWRNPTGRHNKMREKRRGYMPIVSIGYKKNLDFQNTFNGKKIVFVRNMADLKKVGKNEVATLAKIGRKKKITIAKKAKELGINISNLKTEKFLKNLERKDEPK